MTPSPEPDRAAPGQDLAAALSVTLLGVPQGIAYAMIAGLPPAAGLYAATLPAVVGSLTRSSRFVISGPTNALSLLVGGATASLSASLGASPVEVALTLALLVGLAQAGAGLLRLGALVDYISSPVVLGYITGAGTLIALGQLPNLTRSPAGAGPLPQALAGWIAGLGQLHAPSLALGLATLGLLVALRRFRPRWPSATVALGLGVLGSALLDLEGQGLRVVGQLGQTPSGLPPWTVPSLEHARAMLPAALAITVLSLVESTAVARTLASSGGERLDPSREFLGQGLANLTAAFVGGYPVSGSLARSTLNLQAGARSRAAGVLSGGLTLAVVGLAGPLVDLTPVAVLAAVLLLVARDLVDVERVRRAMRARRGDALAFVATVLGTWALPLDQAIYLGVAIAVGMFLRRARLLVVRDMVVDASGRLRELRGARPEGACRAVRALHVEGAAFFGAAGELEDALREAARDPALRVLVLRVKRLQGMDFTTASVLGEQARRMAARGQHLVLAGVRREAMEVLERAGVIDEIGPEEIFPTRARWFRSMDLALAHALELAGEHDDGGACPFAAYLDGRRRRGLGPEDTEARPRDAAPRNPGGA